MAGSGVRGRVGIVAGLAMVAASLSVVASSEDPAQANGTLTGDPTYAIVGQLTGCEGPRGMTVVRNGTADDTVYIACSGNNKVAYITDDSVTGTVSGLIDVGVAPTTLQSAADDTTAQSDDTVYVGYGEPSVRGFSIGAIAPGTVNGGTADDSTTLDVYGYGFTVSSDDTVFLNFDDANNDDSLGVFDPGTAFTVGDSFDDSYGDLNSIGLATLDDTFFSVGAVPTGSTPAFGVGSVNMASPTFPTFDDSLVMPQVDIFWIPTQVAVSEDRLFFTTGASGQWLLWAINPTTLSVDETLAIVPPPAGIQPFGLAANPQGLIVATGDSFATGPSYAQIIDGGSMQSVGQPVLVDTDSQSEAITRSGIAYVGSYDQDMVYRLAKVMPEIDATSGAPGTQVQLTLTPTVANVILDDSTLIGVKFGSGYVATSEMLRVGNTFTFDVPDGCGSAAVEIEMNGQVGVELGTWAYPACPPPPPIPAGPPTSVEAVDVSSPGASSGSGSVSWFAPASSGSFPITQYQVTGSPSGSCIVAAPETSCEVPGLQFGTEYTFTVRALTGAGWGPYSQPSNAIKPDNPEPPPVPTIVISGTRGEVRGKPGVVVTGATTGFAEGTILVPWVRFPGQTTYSAGSARPQVDASGDFTWQRRTGKKIYVSVRTFDGSTKSNRLVIPR